MLSLGCADLRDLLYSVLLHGRRQRALTFVLNDWEPAIQARNSSFCCNCSSTLGTYLLESECAAEVDGIATAGVVGVQGSERKEENTPIKKEPAPGNAEANGGIFARRIGVIFR